jgi:endoglucanase
VDMLQVKEGRIVRENGEPVHLTGVCIGGWMNMENFINGFPGSEENLREAVGKEIGKNKSEFLFDTMLRYVFAEEDVQFIKATGANLVRLALNYRHFEDDNSPFSYKESGFARLDGALSWCEKHGVYAILDMHAVQGWQNTDWHCDNDSRHSLFWKHPHFQDRFIALWEEMARRYKGRKVVAGYDLMNEPLANAWKGRFSNVYIPDWEKFNSVVRRAVKAIRAIDPRHIIYIEGDHFSELFSGMEAPFADNLVYSSHNYIDSGMTGTYPGVIKSLRWDKEVVQVEAWDRGRQVEAFKRHEGSIFAKEHKVPLWISEFGSVYNGPAEQIPDRLRSLDDQLGVYGEFGVHWSMWTYKDMGAMGWVQMDPQSDYMQLLKPVLDAKRELDTDFAMYWLPSTLAKEKVRDLAAYIKTVIDEPYINADANRRYLTQAAMGTYTAMLMQPAYAGKFKGMTEERIDEVLQSFALKNCTKHKGLLEVAGKHMNG